MSAQVLVLLLLTSCSATPIAYHVGTPVAQTAEQQILLGQGIDINTASPESLAALPHIGPALAERIVAERNDHGPFQTPQELRRVKGVGAKTLEKILPFVRTN